MGSASSQIICVMQSSLCTWCSPVTWFCCSNVIIHNVLSSVVCHWVGRNYITVNTWKQNKSLKRILPGHQINNTIHQIYLRYKTVSPLTLPDLFLFNGFTYWDGCNIGYLSDTHLRPRSGQTSFFHYTYVSSRIILKFCTEHGSITASRFLCIRPSPSCHTWHLRLECIRIEY